MTGIKVKVIPQFPNPVIGGAGIDVQKANGNWTISLDYAKFGLNSPYVPQPNHRVVIFTQTSNGYFTIPTSVLAAPFVTFDLSTVHNVTLTNGNLTATNTLTTSTDQGAHVLNTSAKNVGKYYFEIITNNIASNNLASVYGIGVGVTGSTYSNMSTGTGGALFHMIGGSIVAAGSGAGTLGSMNAVGNVIGIALDLDNRNVWFRGVAGPSVGGIPGPWNGTAINGNPATNTGGIGVIAGAMVPYVCFGGTGGLAGDQLTANFGASAFTGPVPSGFNSGWR
jgi:hypothetical protein